MFPFRAFVIFLFAIFDTESFYGSQAELVLIVKPKLASNSIGNRLQNPAHALGIDPCSTASNPLNVPSYTALAHMERT